MKSPTRKRKAVEENAIDRRKKTLQKRGKRSGKVLFKWDGTELRTAEMRQIPQIGWGPLKEQSHTETAGQIPQQSY